MTGKCDVCGKEAETFVVCSSCGAISFAYCSECLRDGLEPYDALVGMGLYSDEIVEIFKQQILLPSLKFHGKTLAEFDADVKRLDEEYYDWLQRQDECVAQECETEAFGE
jgi:hypothetical protein